jgi:hypothetical protein
MTPGSPSADRVRFGVFELDRRSGELRKAGVRSSKTVIYKGYDQADADLMMIEDFH